MSQAGLRCALSVVMALIVPVQLIATNRALGMLYTNGSTWVNGSAVPKSTAVFAGDLVQTQPDSSANISARGSSVMVLADSLVKFEGPAVELEHGAVRVTTAQGLAAHAEEVTVKTAGNSWTEFQVQDLDGTVHIAANKGDLLVQDQQGTTIVQEGQQTTRDDTSNPEQKKKRKKDRPAPAAERGVMSSQTVMRGSILVVAAVTGWVVWQGDDPLSPTCLRSKCN